MRSNQDKFIISRRFLAAAIASGAINLSAEAIWHRLSGILASGTVESTAIVWSVFLLGASLGAAMGYRWLRHIWLLELVPAAWSLASSAAIALGILSLDIPPLLLAVAMLPPAIAIGAHVPVYAAIAAAANATGNADGTAGRVYGLWHVGGAIGIIALAWAGSGFPLSLQLFAIGLVQSAFALLLRKATLSPDAGMDLQSPASGDLSGRGISGLARAWKAFCSRDPEKGRSAFFWTVMTLGVGIFAGAWMQSALGQTFFHSLPLRIVGAGALTASALAGAAGAVLAILFAGRRATLLPLAILLAFLVAGVGGWVAAALMPAADVPAFALRSLGLSIFLMLPLGLTSAWYLLLAQEEGQSFGRIVAAASLGNAIGIALVTMAGYEGLLPAGLVLATIAFFEAPLGLASIRPVLRIATTASVLLATLGLMRLDWFDLETRAAGIARVNGLHVATLAQHSRGLDWWAVTRNRPVEQNWVAGSRMETGLAEEGLSDLGDGADAKTDEAPRDGDRLIMTIDGAYSHDLNSGTEFLPPLVAASYFPERDIENVLVLGIGSGQIAYAAAAIGRHVDVVDISRASIDAVRTLSAFNNGVGRESPMRADAGKEVEAAAGKVTLIVDDALRVLKTCSKRYDVIVNATFSPATIGAGNLHAEEAVALARNCLTPRGIYFAYRSSSMAGSLGDYDLFVRPLARHFAAVDLLIEPYGAVIGRPANRLSIGAIEKSAFIDETAPAYLARGYPSLFGGLESGQSIGIRGLPDYRPSEGVLPTLDNGLGERQSVPLYLKVNADLPIGSTVRPEIEALIRASAGTQ